MRTLATLITGLGDAAVLLPAALVLMICLARSRSWRAASAWVAALALCAFLTIATKIIFHACGGAFPSLAIRSPSGHTSLSATFYGCSALILSANQSGSRRLALYLASGGLVLAIAASRVALHAHTVEEVVGGLAIGLLCLGFYAAYCLPRSIDLPDWRVPVAALVALAVLTHGRHLGVEGVLDRFAGQLRVAHFICPLREDVAASPRPAAPVAIPPTSEASLPPNGVQPIPDSAAPVRRG
jgi:membrane-associated phospholipid phosphatase